MRLKGKIILITGATSGIGLTTAQRCITEGAFVIFTGRNQQDVEQIQQQLGQKSLGFICDAANVPQQKQLIQQLQKLTLSIRCPIFKCRECPTFKI